MKRVKPEPLDRFIRQREVLTILGVARSTLYVWRRSGHFPHGIQIGPNVVAWRESELRRWMLDRNAP